jgi:thiamine-monophosphate kinase
MTEKHFIEKLHAMSRATGFKDIGDDAAIVSDCNILSTDQFIEGTHFLWSHMSAEKLGYKSIVQALSDLAAMGAEPRAILTSLAWHEIHAEKIESYLDGIQHACLDYKVPLVGGDITRSPNTFYSDITVCGWSTSPIKKSGAQPQDILVLTGTVGDARAGLETVSSSLSTAVFRERYEKPVAQLNTIRQILELTAVTSCTDISDSLSKSTLALAHASHVGMIIDSESIPVSNELKKYVLEQNKNIEDYKWNSGEDYQLLLTVPATTPHCTLIDYGLTVIGRVTSDLKVLIKNGDTHAPLTEVGWDPFAL